MKRVLAIALFAISPLLARAGELGHNHLEAGVSRLDMRIPSHIGPDLHFDGGYLRGEFALNPSWYGFGSVQRGDAGLDYDLTKTETRLGIGYAHALGGRSELLAELGYAFDDFGGIEVEGARASAGMRTMLGARMEGWAKATYSDRPWNASRYSAQAGALFRLNDRWGVSGDVDMREDETRYGIGLRAGF